MSGIGQILDSPFAPALAACLGLALVFGLVHVFAKKTWIIDIGAPLIFLAAYYQTYQKVPAFPPVGAANKVFYVGLVASIVIFAAERLPSRLPSAIEALFAAIIGVVWIANAQWAHADRTSLAIAAAVVVGGALLLWGIERRGADPASGGSASALAVLGAVSALLAPVALFGGSSTSVGVYLGVAAGLAVLSIAYLVSPVAVSRTAVFGVGAGVLALIEPTALIAKKADLLALAVVVVAPFLANLAVGRLPNAARRRSALVWFVAGLAALSPLVAIVALLFARHESPL